MFEELKGIYAKCRQQANRYGVSTMSVLLDHLHARFCYGFCGEDYFLNTPGYAMKNFQKKEFFSYKEWIRIRKQLNDEKFSSILNNKVESLKFFSKFIKHGWCYPAEHSEEQFKQFVASHQRIICKPISGEGGQGIGLYSPSANGGGIKS